MLHTKNESFEHYSFRQFFFATYWNHIDHFARGSPIDNFDVVSSNCANFVNSRARPCLGFRQ